MKTCENCGCRVYKLGCVNCNESAYIEQQDELNGPAGERCGTSIAANVPVGVDERVTDESPGAIPNHICGICYHPFDQCGHCHAQDVVQLVREVAAMRGQRDKLRAALVGLVGVDTREELEQLEGVMRLMPAPAQDKAATIDAIHALIATTPAAPQAVVAVDPQAGSPTE